MKKFNKLSLHGQRAAIRRALENPGKRRKLNRKFRELHPDLYTKSNELNTSGKKIKMPKSNSKKPSNPENEITKPQKPTFRDLSDAERKKRDDFIEKSKTYSFLKKYPRVQTQEKGTRLLRRSPTQTSTSPTNFTPKRPATLKRSDNSTHLKAKTPPNYKRRVQRLTHDQIDGKRIKPEHFHRTYVTAIDAVNNSHKSPLHLENALAHLHNAHMQANELFSAKHKKIHSAKERNIKKTYMKKENVEKAKSLANQENGAKLVQNFKNSLAKPHHDAAETHEYNAERDRRQRQNQLSELHAQLIHKHVKNLVDARKHYDKMSYTPKASKHVKDAFKEKLGERKTKLLYGKIKPRKGLKKALFGENRELPDKIVTGELIQRYEEDIPSTYNIDVIKRITKEAFVAKVKGGLHGAASKNLPNTLGGPNKKKIKPQDLLKKEKRKIERMMRNMYA